jgi:hypothetical protein
MDMVKLHLQVFYFIISSNDLLPSCSLNSRNAQVKASEPVMEEVQGTVVEFRSAQTGRRSRVPFSILVGLPQ